MLRLRELRKSKGISQKLLADDLSFSQNAISNWELGIRIPDVTTLKILSDYFNVTVDYFLGDSAINDKVQIPVLGSIPAGVPLEAIEDVIGWEELSPNYSAGGKDYFALKIKGDSMSPKYIEGDIVVFERTSCCESGKDCAVFVNGDDATFKKVIKKETGIALQPINPSYDVHFYDNDDIQSLPITVIGVAIEIRRPV